MSSNFKIDSFMIFQHDLSLFSKAKHCYGGKKISKRKIFFSEKQNFENNKQLF